MEIPPCVLISPVPMMIPEWPWTLSTNLFLWEGTGNSLYFKDLHELLLFCSVKYQESGRKVLSLLFYSCLTGGSSLWMGAQSHYMECHWKSVLFLKEENAGHNSHTTAAVTSLTELKAQPLPCVCFRGFALGCARMWVPQHHPAMSSTDLLQICQYHHHPDGGTAECHMLLCFQAAVLLHWGHAMA